MEHDTQTNIEEQIQEETSTENLNPEALQTVTGGSYTTKAGIVGATIGGLVVGVPVGLANKKSQDHGVGAGLGGTAFGALTGGVIGVAIGKKRGMDTKIAPSNIELH